MEAKTKITAAPGTQEMKINREFELPVHLLFRAYTEPDLLEAWMGSKALKLETHKHGAYQLEKKDSSGNVVFRANGVFHEWIPMQKIVRTFEMESAPLGVQLEFLEFESLGEDNSRLRIHILFESNEKRDLMLQFGMPAGLNQAHNRLQQALKNVQ